MPDPIIAAQGRAVAQRLHETEGVQAVTGNGVTLYVRQQFLTPDECAGLIALAMPVMRPSAVLSSTHTPGFRTSTSGDLDRFDPFVQAIDARIGTLLGLRARQGETIQAQRYAVGQVFKAHHDYFHRQLATFAEETARGGQRTWTAMIYLDTPESGGETQFPHAGLCVQPRAAMLLAWNNADAKGDPNPATLHESLPVTAGVKTVVTKWFRAGNWL